MTDSTLLGIPSSYSYLSTTIPYVNAAPHVGFALELAQADALARYERLCGRPLFTVTGTDDHSLKNVRAAEASGEPVTHFVERNARAFAELAGRLGASFDAFVSTSRDPRHAPAVERLFRLWNERGDLYRRHYRGNYCVGCEQFLRSNELVNGLCPEHLCAPELVEEENWFFRLSRYRAEILRAIEGRRLRIVPEERRDEVLAFVRAGLEDFSVSRSAGRARGFGIRVPGDPAQVVYVWVDALAYYLSAGDFGRLGGEVSWQRASLRRTRAPRCRSERRSRSCPACSLAGQVGRRRRPDALAHQAPPRRSRRRCVPSVRWRSAAVRGRLKPRSWRRLGLPSLRLRSSCRRAAPSRR